MNRYKSAFLLFSVCSFFFSAYAQPGTLDSDFSADGKQTVSFFSGGDDTAYSMIQLSDTKILIAGTSNNGTNNFGSIVRLNSDGSLDGNFGVAGKVTIGFPPSDVLVKSMAIQADHKIVVAGTYLSVFGESFLVARFLPNGIPDSTFGGDGVVITSIGANSDIAFDVKIQSDQKIVVGGTAKNANNFFDFAVTRYLVNGNLDSTFSLDGKATIQPLSVNGNSYIRSIHVLSGDRILAIGYSKSINFGDHDVFSLVQLNSNGTLDLDFDTDGKLNGDIDGESTNMFGSIVITDNKILMGGMTNDSMALVRLHLNGAFDTTFNHTGFKKLIFFDVTPLGVINAVNVQQDGKILAVGRRSSSLSGGAFALCRLNDTGTVDSTFDTDGKVILIFGSGVAQGVGNAIAVQEDGRILVAGMGDENPDGSFAVARYHSGLNLGVLDFSSVQKSVLAYPNPVSDFIKVKYTLMQPDTISVRLFDLQGRLIATLLENEIQHEGEIERQFSIPASLNRGNFLLNVLSQSGNVSVQLSKL
jgi:uncharacterized delta-60 repeat protein